VSSAEKVQERQYDRQYQLISRRDEIGNAGESIVNNERPIPNWLLAVLRCPITRDPLRIAPIEVVELLQDQARQGVLSNKLGRTISEVSTQGLVNASNTWFYEIKESICQLMPDDAISIDFLRIPPTGLGKSTSPA
jgi:uncharacterized protein YbaR (Trm112 family)